MTRLVAVLLAGLIVAAPGAALACAGGFFTFTNAFCTGQMQLRVCLGDRGNSLLFVLRKGEALNLNTAANSSFSWSCTGEPAAVCPSAYCVNGP
jgi:hypothetical protein